MIVFDASAILELFLQRPRAGTVRRWLSDMSQVVHAPHLIDIEVAHVIRRYAADGEIDAERGRTALISLTQLPVRRHAHHFLLQRVWELRHNLTGYDAAYVALAEALDAPLLTCDGRLACATGHHAAIELI